MHVQKNLTATQQKFGHNMINVSQYKDLEQCQQKKQLIPYTLITGITNVLMTDTQMER